MSPCEPTRQPARDRQRLNLNSDATPSAQHSKGFAQDPPKHYMFTPTVTLIMTTSCKQYNVMSYYALRVTWDCTPRQPPTRAHVHTCMHAQAQPSPDITQEEARLESMSMLADNDMLEEEPLLLPSLVCAAPLPLLPLPLPLPMSLLAAAAVAAASARAVSCRVDSSRAEVGQPQPTPGVTWRILLKKKLLL